MKLYANITSERASKKHGGNEFVFVDFTAGDKDNSVGQIELYLFDDDEKYGDEENEWLLKWRKNEDCDWDILTQGHIEGKPKGKKQKDEKRCKVCGQGSESEPECDSCVF